MALDETVAGASSDTYGTVAEATAYLAQKSGTTWTALETSEKEAYLKQAARLIDRETYDGIRYDCATQTAGQTPGQALEFPRADDVDYAGDPFVHAAVKNCQFELAWSLASGSAEVVASESGISRLKVGGVEMEFTEEASSSTGDSVRDIIRYWLKDFLATGALMG